MAAKVKRISTAELFATPDHARILVHRNGRGELCPTRLVQQNPAVIVATVRRVTSVPVDAGDTPRYDVLTDQGTMRNVHGTQTYALAADEGPALMFTPGGTRISQGLPVWTNNLTVGTVDLSRLSHDGWFEVVAPGETRGALMSADRVDIRHPFTRELAADVLAGIVAKRDADAAAAAPSGPAQITIDGAEEPVPAPVVARGVATVPAQPGLFADERHDAARHAGTAPLLDVIGTPTDAALPAGTAPAGPVAVAERVAPAPAPVTVAVATPADPVAVPTPAGRHAVPVPTIGPVAGALFGVDDARKPAAERPMIDAHGYVVEAAAPDLPAEVAAALAGVCGLHTDPCDRCATTYALSREHGMTDADLLADIARYRDDTVAWLADLTATRAAGAPERDARRAARAVRVATGDVPTVPAVADLPVDGWHVGRSWSGDALERGCPCVKAPCRLVAKESPACREHNGTHTYRQMHRADRCPGPAPVRPVPPASGPAESPRMRFLATLAAYTEAVRRDARPVATPDPDGKIIAVIDPLTSDPAKVIEFGGRLSVDELRLELLTAYDRR